MNTIHATPAEPARFSRILVPIDTEAPTHRALDEAIGIARLSGASLRVVSVFDECHYLRGFEPAKVVIERVVPEAHGRSQRTLGDACRRAEEAGVAADSRLLEGGAADIAHIVAAEAADGVDLVVLGTHARRGLDRVLLGSVAETILRLSPVPVMIVREIAG